MKRALFIGILLILLISDFVSSEMLVNKNSSLEEGTENKPNFWTYSSDENAQAEFIWANRYAHSGNYSIGIKKAIGKNYWIFREFPIDPERIYEFSCFIKTIKATGKNYIAFLWGGGGAWSNESFAGISYIDGKFYKGIGEEKSESVAGNNDWKQIRIKAIPPEGATWVCPVCVSEDNSGEVYFDDVEIKEYLKGITVFMSQVGYHPESVKKPLIASEEYEGKGEFRILDYTTHIVEGKTVHKGELKYLGKSLWYPHLYLADFSDFKKPGLYKLVVRFENGKGLLSRNFVIREDVYQKVLDKVHYWFYVHRTGPEVKPWHKECFKEKPLIALTEGDLEAGDFKVLKIIGRFDYPLGGWFDTAYDNHIAFWWIGTLAFTEAYKDLNLPKDLKKKILDEAKWGGDWLLKVQRKDGSFYHHTNYVRVEKTETGEWKGVGVPHDCPPSEIKDYYFDEAPGYWDMPIFENAMAGAALAALAGVYEGINKEYSKELLKVAEKNWEYVAVPGKKLAVAKHLQESVNIAQPYKTEWTFGHGAVLLLDTYLYLNTKKEKYKDDALRRVNEILKMQIKEGYFALSEENKGARRGDHDYYDRAFIPEIALSRWAKYFPYKREEIKNSLKRFLNFLEPHLNTTPFHQLSEFSVGPNPRLFPDHEWTDWGPIAYYHGCVNLLGEIYELFREKKWLNYAEQLLQWYLGRNPRGVCLVEDCGWRNPNTGHEYLCDFIPRDDAWYENERWLVPGSVSFGIMGGGRCAPQLWGHLSDDYPIIEFGYHHSGAGCFSEPWPISQASFILGLAKVNSSLAKAYPY